MQFSAGEWSLILAHDSRPTYRALTSIAVPLLGPHQPWYIKSTLYFDLNFTTIYSQISNQQSATIDSDNDLAPNKQQAIIWINGGIFHWCIDAFQLQKFNWQLKLVCHTRLHKVSIPVSGDPYQGTEVLLA